MILRSVSFLQLFLHYHHADYASLSSSQLKAMFLTQSSTLDYGQMYAFYFHFMTSLPPAQSLSAAV